MVQLKSYANVRDITEMHMETYKMHTPSTDPGPNLVRYNLNPI